MALRNASASARSRSARRRLRLSRTSTTITVTSAIDMAVTSAVSTLGNRLGALCQVSMRSTRVLPGRSSRCVAVNMREPRRAAPSTASRVPSASVNEASWLRVRLCATRLISTSCSEYVTTRKPVLRPPEVSGRHSSIISEPSPSPWG